MDNYQTFDLMHITLTVNAVTRKYFTNKIKNAKSLKMLKTGIFGGEIVD